MEIEAKPTEYAGVMFRSRLEATWARLFDVIGLAWEYEPTHLAGWIPDFLIDGWWLAEVKPTPILWTRDTADPVLQKAIRPFDTVLLGDGPGSALGLVVRRLQSGGVYARYLFANIEDGPATLHPLPMWPTGIECPLQKIWQGLVETSGNWGAAPFKRVVTESAKHFGGHAA